MLEDYEKQILTLIEATFHATDLIKIANLKNRFLQAVKGEIKEEMSPEDHQHIKRVLFPEGSPPAVKKLKMMKIDADSDAE